MRFSVEFKGNRKRKCVLETIGYIYLCDTDEIIQERSGREG
jgi:hypothetical protein